ncbi:MULTISPECIES: alpha/beta fold hydrolase [Haloferax]|uniref:Alpha/beta fold hydrolase n=2 Tax=Haloferax TaxID=2251 RepID=A0A6G1Z649_9EURY|nr:MULTISPECIES: alpha/beta hydrolase [Haloferax]KAB1185395.1 alpha/beta hydrolase [Haloferax sp. CBA1149]MRW82039.1 alpha/beta fold hydrolase [Haloferax marinisediminis]
MSTSADSRTPEHSSPAEETWRGGFEAAQRTLFDAVGLDAKSTFIDLGHPYGRTHVFEAGSSTDDVPLLFVHGTAAFGAFLSPLMAQFGDARVVGFDRPGYGLSEAFVCTEQNLRQTVVDVIGGVVDELNIEQVDLVGHSMGGHAGILFANAHPERVRNLLLVGGIPAFPGTRPPLPLRALTVPLLNRVIRRLQKPDEAGVLDIAEVFGERDAIQDYPAFIQAIAAHERDPNSAAAGLSEFNALLSIRGWHRSVRISDEELRGLEHPTTMVWGEHDPLGRPDDVRASVQLIPNARFESVASGHIPYLRHPEQCAQFIREARKSPQ